MDAKKLLTDTELLVQALLRGADLLYARQSPGESEHSIDLAFRTTAPLSLALKYENEILSCRAWRDIVEQMTVRCDPPAIVLRGTVIFQLCYLDRVILFSNEKAHFVILDFGNNRNLWLGSKEREDQLRAYREIAVALGSGFKEVRNLRPPKSS